MTQYQPPQQQPDRNGYERRADFYERLVWGSVKCFIAAQIVCTLYVAGNISGFNQFTRIAAQHAWASATSDDKKETKPNKRPIEEILISTSQADEK